MTLYLTQNTLEESWKMLNILLIEQQSEFLLLQNENSCSLSPSKFYMCATAKHENHPRRNRPKMEKDTTNTQQMKLLRQKKEMRNNKSRTMTNVLSKKKLHHS